MSERGFAMIAVLWVVTALTALTGVTLAFGRVGGAASGNRIYLTRAGWAREACLEIVRARLAADWAALSLDTVRLGRGAWCHAWWEDPAARIDLNAAGYGTLTRLFGDEAFAAAILDWRDPDDIARSGGAEAAWYRDRGMRVPRNEPLAAVEELLYVRGHTSQLAERAQRFATVRGDHNVNVNGAPAEVLNAVTFLPDGAARVIAAHRAAGRRFATHEDVTAVLGAAGLSIGFVEYRAFASQVVFAPRVLVARVHGGVDGTPLVSRETAVFGRTSSGWSVVRRSVE